METVTKGNVLYDQLGKLTGVRSRLEGSAKALENEVSNDRKNLEFSPNMGEDEGVSMMLENAENTVFQMKREMVADLEHQMDITDEQISKLVSGNQPGDIPATANEEEDEKAVKESGSTTEKSDAAPITGAAESIGEAPAISQPAAGGVQPSTQTPSAEPGAIVDVRV